MLELINRIFTINLVYRLAALVLVLVVATILVDYWRRPWLLHWRVNRILQRSRIRNRLKEYPTLKRVRKSPDKDHELLLEFDSKGLGLPDFDKYLDRWKVGLNGMIRMDVGDKTNSILLYYLPHKYVRSTLISPMDNAIGPIGVQHLINLLVIGATGTGKTVIIKIIMDKIAKFKPNSKIWLLDFKRFDFREFLGLPHYYGYTDCFQGLKDYYAAFKAQQKAGVAGAPNYLIIDEWGSFIMSLDKKQAEQAKSILSELLMLGRAYNFIPIIGIQRPDASYFNGGRDNFQACLALGNLSPEGRRMVFPDSVKEQITICKKREGHLYIDGIGLEKVKIENIEDMEYRVPLMVTKHSARWALTASFAFIIGFI